MTVQTTLRTHFRKSAAELLYVAGPPRPETAAGLSLRLTSAEPSVAGRNLASTRGAARWFGRMGPRADGAGSKGAVGIVLPHAEQESGQICDGIHAVLSAAGFAGLVLPRAEKAWRGTAVTDLGAMEGVLFPGTARSVEGLPSVSFADPAAPLEAADISVDRESLLRSALQHLTAHGHRRIALLFTTGSDFASEEARRGIQNAGRHAGLHDLQSVHLQDSQQPWIAHHGVTIRDLLSKERVTAFVCCDSRVADCTITAARGVGLHCPSDFSVVSCGARNRPGRAAPGTAVLLPWRTIGSIAAHQLLAKLRRPLATPAGVILVQPRVVQGWSSAGLA